MFAEVLNGYSEDLRANVPKSIYHYRSHARTFLRWLARKSVPLGAVAAEHVDAYLRYRRSSGNRLQTLKNDLCRLRHFFRFAQRQGVVTGDPTERVSTRWLNVAGGFPAYRGSLARALGLRPAFLLRYRLEVFGSDWEQFLERLIEQGYTRPGIRTIARHNQTFHGYLRALGIRRATQVKPAHVDAFVQRADERFRRLRGRPASRQFRNRYSGAVLLFLRFAFGRRGRVFGRPKAASKSAAVPDEPLSRYLGFCRSHRGLQPVTLESHAHVLRLLTSFLGRRGVRRIEAATITHYDAFLIECAKSRSHASLFRILGVLRGFLRCLYLEGVIARDLARDLIAPRRFGADFRPKYLPWRKIEELLDGIERDPIVGKRDYAILVLLAYHGLRAREVAKLALSDIDLDTPSLLLLHQKNGATSRISLSPQAKQALEDYLAVRPACGSPEVFLTVRAPIRPLGSNLYSVAHARLKERFGRVLPAQGSRLLRHSFAKLLLDRRARLQDVSLLLRQRSPASAQAYARIAVEDLREVADNYANLLAAGVGEAATG